MVQKKYGEDVVLVRNGVAVKALVALSTLQQVTVKGVPNEFQKENGLHVPDATVIEEHLTVVYLDPAFANQAMGSTTLDAAIRKVIGVAPLAEGGVNGWKAAEAAPVDRAEGTPGAETLAQIAAAHGEVETGAEPVAEARTPVEEADATVVEQEQPQV